MKSESYEKNLYYCQSACLQFSYYNKIPIYFKYINSLYRKTSLINNTLKIIIPIKDILKTSWSREKIQKYFW